MSELEEIDWKNPDVKRLFEVLGKQFDKMNQEMQDLKKENREVVAENSKVVAENIQLKATIEKLKKKRGRKGNVRSYNTREFKGYPHVESKQAAQIRTA